MDAKLVLLIVALLTIVVEHHVNADLIWHGDEIPYYQKARCWRGHTYYTNSLNANQTDIDVGSDVENLLDYSNPDTCFFCVCSVHGEDVHCIPRRTWYCSYYRYLRPATKSSEMYINTFGHERPAYYRQLSFRLRRTMDEGIHEYIDSVGGGNSAACIPNVSSYTDCTEENLCSGCKRCECTDQAVWECSSVHKCPEDVSRLASGEEPLFDENMIENAIQQMEIESKKKYFTNKMNSANPFVPTPEEEEEKVPSGLEPTKYYGSFEEDILKIMSRTKRSVKFDNAQNDTVKFYNTVDEINEDTLKKTKKSGTIEANRVEQLRNVPLTRRSGVLTNTNSSLNIKFNHPNVYNHHITDNKIDTTHHEDHIDALIHDKINTIIGNSSQNVKTKELSKLIVNELKKGTEIIGDKQASVMSNVTFTPENDTLTAMAFIAGNLLNKLWNMEKDGDESLELDILKHEKIADLLDLFKEPLSMRQEKFLKNALEQLSSAVNVGNVENISICKSIQEASKVLRDSKNGTKDEKLYEATKDCSLEKDKNEANNPQKLSEKAVSKIHNVFNLIKKYEEIKKHLGDLKNNKNTDSPHERKQMFNDSIYESALTKDENSSLNTFGNILEKLTKLILPSEASKKFSQKLKNHNKHSVNKKINKMFNIDITNSSLSAKDKLLANYLDHIQRNPGCVLNDKSNESNDRSLPNVEGDILYNLSEFLKVNSLVDLLKMVDPAPVFKKTFETTTKTVPTAKPIEVRKENIRKTNDMKFSSAKEKLKAHLKTIVEDLIELQNASGSLGKRDSIKIVDALPCIYNILHGKTIPKANNNIAPIDKIRNMFESLKTEISSTQTRRTNPGVGEGRRKSVVVWERIVKNLDKKLNIKTRRNLVTEAPLSFESIKKVIDKLESTTSNSYKKYAFMAEVPSSDKLILLKTIQADTRKYTSIMENLQGLMEQDKILSLQNRKEIDEFLDNAASNVRLNARLIETLNKPKVTKTRYEIKNTPEIELKDILSPRKPTVTQVAPGDYYESSKTISRDELINRLIKNRVQLFIETKETAGDFVADMNYDIAKKILVHMDNGNSKLARELYKFFISRSQDNANMISDNFQSQIKTIEELRPIALTQKEPLIHFVKPKDDVQAMAQDDLLKQLLNIKHMRM